MKWTVLLFGTVATLAGGCNRGPAPIPSTRFNVKRCVAKAMELHDSDGDGVLSAEELEASPGLNYAANRMDSSGDGSLDADELTAMIEGWNQKTTGLIEVRCNVRYKRRALTEAEVRLEPEPFLEGVIESAIGITDEYGDAYLTVPKAKRPVADAPPGVQLGLYRVTVSKLKGAKETLPAKFNSETTYGQEVAFDDPGISNGMVKIELK